MLTYKYLLFAILLIINITACANIALSPEQVRYVQYENEITRLLDMGSQEEAARISMLKLDHSRINFKTSNSDNLYYLSLHESQQLLTNLGKIEEASELYKEELVSLSKNKHDLHNNPTKYNAAITQANTVLNNTKLFVHGNDELEVMKKYITFLIVNNYNTGDIDRYIDIISANKELVTAGYLYEIAESLKSSNSLPEGIRAELISKSEKNASEIYDSKLDDILSSSYDVKFISKAGHFYMSINNYTNAEKCFQRIVAVEDNLNANGNEFAKVQSAFALIDTMSSHKLPDLMDGVLMLAECYFRQGKREKVYELYNHYSDNVKLRLNSDLIKDMNKYNDIAITIKENPANILYYDKFADFFWSYNDIELAAKLYKKSADLSFESMNLFYSAFLPEELRTSTVNMRQPFNRIINFAFKTNDQALISDAFESWANYKGYMVSFDKERWKAIEKINNPKLNQEFTKYINAKRILSGYSLSQIYRYKKLQEILQDKAKSEMVLSRLLSTSTFQIVPWIKLDDIKNRIPKSSIYIDFAKISEIDNQTLTGENLAYYAFVLNPERGNINLIRIGPCEQIDSLINDYRRSVNNAVKLHQVPSDLKLKEVSEKLYDLIYTPLVEHVSSTNEIIISPDGALNLIPFEIFSKNGKNLYESVALSYLPAFRDAIQSSTPQKANGEVVIFSDPDYDMEYKDSLDNQVNSTRNINISRLPDTVNEAKNIESVFSSNHTIKQFTGKDATEQNLFSIKNPEILHIATHGFYKKNESDLKASQRSGLYLARANTGIQSGIRGGVGIMNSEKIAWLPLNGTKIVSLSACSTGVGDISDSEGVFGLQRAFLTSGASTLLVSLWDVPSKETADLMSEFYKQWSLGVSKSTALTKAKAIMARKNSNPYYWASFILVGEPN